jgi:hypothetical protein
LCPSLMWYCFLEELGFIQPFRTIGVSKLQKKPHTNMLCKTGRWNSVA